ncbi:DUF427 domain-containing protein [Aurantimonas sp. Leaf443]|uniref:DUF427 domain-containing protein n=1 Tax=Aurantimonas sp. Leaf443 TaxID=1736378 RepID=UPI0006FC2D58|nr:DUF427 domain-containing protein [Aurantimonas sp. Leaf443]KQT83154.1 hypothetical protein ASG48_14395 [Aurantimonas sp. Leaf443]
MSLDPAPTRSDPIAIAPARGAVVVDFHGAIVASTKRALRLSEDGYEPVYYIPKEDVEMAFLHETNRRTTCPHKGEARYWSISAEGMAAENAVWAYDTPKAGVAQIAGHVAFDKRHVVVKADEA